MEPEIKAKWVAALRSGQYEQGCYHTQDNFFGVLPPVLGDRVSLSDTVANRLIDMDDKEGKTFAEIADYIEQHA